MRAIIVLALIALVGCGGSSGDGDTSTQSFSGPDVSGVWVGSYWDASGFNGEFSGQSERILALISQDGARLSGTYETTQGGEGPLTGTVTASGLISVTLESCEGRFLAEGSVIADTMDLNVIGEDCAVIIRNELAILNRIDPIPPRQGTINGTYRSNRYVLGIEETEGEITGYILSHQFDLTERIPQFASGTISGQLPELDIVFDEGELPTRLRADTVTLSVLEVTQNDGAVTGLRGWMNFHRGSTLQQSFRSGRLF